MEDNVNVTEAVEDTTADQEVETAVKTFTQEEVMRLIQSESDKRVTQALASQQKKFDKQMSLSKLDDQEREREESRSRIAELEEQLAQFHVERNRSELKSVLSSHGLSAEFADIITINDDIEASRANIDKLDKLFKQAVKAEVEKRLGASGAKPTKGVETRTMTKKDAAKLTLKEMNDLAETDPEAFKKLFN